MVRSSLPSSEREAVCYLCLDTGADEPLRRDCACRGTDAGFVHLSCLAKYAAAKSVQAHDMDAFRKPWLRCPSCHQEYQNEFAVDIATEFVSFVRGQCPDDTQMQVEALHLKMRARNSMFDRLQPVQKKEAGVTASVLLSLIDRLKGIASPLPWRYSKFEQDAYNHLGRIALDEGTKESARRAVAHYQKSLKVSEAIGDDEGIATAKHNIAVAKSKYEGGYTSEEMVKTSKEIYELRVAENGEEQEYTIDAGIIYALDLLTANRGDEATVLLMKLLATSKQVLGSHHNITKDIESTLKEVADSLDRISHFFCRFHIH